jgi:phytoene synthase
VAGVVGLVSLRIWGYEGGAATEKLAIARGVAFQLTNILRDLREDAARGRLYLPHEELAAYGLEPRDLTEGAGSDGFDRFMRFQIERAESYYEKSASLESWIEKDSRATVMAMTDIYHGLLKKMAADPRRVLRERISLSLLHKLRIGWRATRGSGARGGHRSVMQGSRREVDGL